MICLLPKHPIMKVFVNEKTIRIIKLSNKLDDENYDHVVLDNKPILSTILVGKVLVKSADLVQMMDFIKILSVQDIPTLDTIIFAFEKKKTAISYFKEHFSIVEAAGGIVQKEDKVLLIYRKEKWDLPKGKAEKGETIEQTAVREVSEECNVTVKLGEKIGKTYHTYLYKEKRVLKKTY